MECPRCKGEVPLSEYFAYKGGEPMLVSCGACQEIWNVAVEKLTEIADVFHARRPSKREIEFMVTGFMLGSVTGEDADAVTSEMAMAASILVAGALPERMKLGQLSFDVFTEAKEDAAWLAGVMDMMEERTAEGAFLPSGLSQMTSHLCGTHSPWEVKDEGFYKKVEPYLNCCRNQAKISLGIKPEEGSQRCAWHCWELAESESTHSYLAGVFDLIGRTHESISPKLENVMAVVRTKCRYIPEAFKAMYGGETKEDGDLLVWRATGSPLEQFLRKVYPYLKAPHVKYFSELEDLTMGDVRGQRVLDLNRAKFSVKSGSPSKIPIDPEDAPAIAESAKACPSCMEVMSLDMDGFICASGGMSVLEKVKHLEAHLGIVVNLQCGVCLGFSSAHTWEDHNLAMCKECQKGDL